MANNKKQHGDDRQHYWKLPHEEHAIIVHLPVYSNMFFGEVQLRPSMLPDFNVN